MIFRGPNRKRFGRVTVVAAHDIFMAALAFELSVWTRYQTYGAPQDFFFLWEATLIFAVVGGLVFWWGGLYRGIWHYASFTDLAAIARAVTSSTRWPWLRSIVAIVAHNPLVARVETARFTPTARLR